MHDGMEVSVFSLLPKCKFHIQDSSNLKLWTHVIECLFHIGLHNFKNLSGWCIFLV